MAEIRLGIEAPFGVLPGRSFDVQPFPIEPGDRIVFLTDSMRECNAASLDVAAVLEATAGDLRDDATMVCRDRYGGPPRGRTTEFGADPEPPRRPADPDVRTGPRAGRYRLATMRIDRAGWPFITGPLAPAAVLAVAGPRGTRWLASPFVALSAYMALFFRDPDRRCDSVPPDPDDVLSPADGVVMVAGEPQDGVAPEGEWQQVSVFLSVVDVHVNRSPYRGEVVESSYRKGSFLAAYRKESAHRNERTEIWLRDTEGPTARTVVFRQIVGVLARRIVTRTGPGQRLATGERMGLMKFGSRMDVFLPPECTLTVAKGQRVRGGETVIARWPATG
ncbi:phosphatidylserine decarboxylase precursor-related protein [Blastococcus mobilis]|uniref:Phosphatidylserine decarboxylase proenzyme n=1 Tax=Blastococcus mobilis TaxID=1938746 RepID=A0A238WF46_9ACTN|nr:phosphatidylserine decarboxylase precursor-related protein [Blastococcus mobilis]